VEYLKNETVTLVGNTGNLIMQGYDFGGWGETASATTALTQIDITEDTTVYAIWEGDNGDPIEVTVTYARGDATSGDVAAPATETYLKHATVTVRGNNAANPLAREPYAFLGWTTSQPPVPGVAEYSENDTFVVTEDITLYPAWEANPSTFYITYHNLQGATHTNPDSYTAVPVVLSDPSVRTGYNFTGWYTTEDYQPGTKIETITDYKNYELWAQWGGGKNNPTVYTITYDTASLGGGSLAPQSPTSFTVEDLPVSVPNASRNGYTFAGWYLDAAHNTQLVQSGGVWQITTVGDKVLYARWNNIPSGPNNPGGGGGTNIPDSTTPLAQFEGDHIPYIFGYPDGTVRPERNITRAEIAVIFFRLLADDEKTVPRVSNFRDVRSGAWYAQAVAYLESLGILLGYPDGTFKPDRPISRAEFAAVAARFDELDSTTENAFSDIPSTHWALSYINSAAVRGWVQGFPDNTFRPDERTSRAQVVTVINRMLQRILRTEDIPSDITTFTDLPRNHWAYADIIEASTDHDRYDVRIRPDGSEVWTTKTAAASTTSEETQSAA
jgi:uncharacterized repeat protein (TIGR02543 family)